MCKPVLWASEECLEAGYRAGSLLFLNGTSQGHADCRRAANQIISVHDCYLLEGLQAHNRTEEQLLSFHRLLDSGLGLKD